jgi:signal transduction histidine kinase
VELLRPEAEVASISLSTHAPNGPVRLELDDEKIRQVLINLVRNAIEASAPGGRIEVTARPNGAVAELVVEDDGPGMPSYAPIFEPFFTTKEQGTGLGLAIVHRIVMDHGGHVSVESKPGQTRFLVTLPRLPQLA